MFMTLELLTQSYSKGIYNKVSKTIENTWTTETAALKTITLNDQGFHRIATRANSITLKYNLCNVV